MFARLKLFAHRLVTYFPVPGLVFWLALPFGVAGVALGIGRALDTDHWASEYFTPAYLELYAHPRDTMTLTAQAIVEDDQKRLLELQASLEPDVVIQRSELAYLFPYAYYTGYQRHLIYDQPGTWHLMAEPDVSYAEYLYADRETREMLIYTVRQINGRWVYVPDSATLYMQKGRWLPFWRAYALIYYFGFIMRVGWLYIERNNAAQRAARLAQKAAELQSSA